MQKNIFIGQTFYIKPSYLVTLPIYSGGYNYDSAEFIKNKENLKDNKTKGELSYKAVKAIKNSINWLLVSAEEKKVYHKEKDYFFNFKIGFITLTVPLGQMKLTNHQFKTLLLNPWLTLMRSNYGLKNYVWKLELQKNGQPHLHISVDSFIHHSVIKRTWNKLLNANGFLEEYKTKHYNITFEAYRLKYSNFRKSSDEQLFKSWEQGTKSQWTQPNSTDIHSLRKIKNLAAYIIKYMAKNGNLEDNFNGKIWGCSQNISKANKTKIQVTQSQSNELIYDLMQSKSKSKSIAITHKYTLKTKSIGLIFLLCYSDWINKIKGHLKDIFEQTILEIRGLFQINNIVNTV
jgi:hypothetical protein